MDFRIIVINDSSDLIEDRVFDQYVDALNFINMHMSQWNNFTPENPLYIRIMKVGSTTNTLGVTVADEFKVADIFGRQ